VDPALAQFIARTCAATKVPVPRFGLVRDGNPTAFTFGHYPGDARLAVTTGLLDMLDSEECQAVVAHELGHIAHWDFVVMTVAAVASSLALEFNVGAVGIVLLLVSAAWWLKRWFSYNHDFRERRTVRSLIGKVKVSAVRFIPGTIEGQIIGRGVPGLFYSEDLVLQDDTGFIVVDYRQPLRFLEFLFGWVKAGQLIGQRGKVMGWYRRSPNPYFEMRKLVLENGETVTSYSYPVTQFLVYAGMSLGAILAGAAGFFAYPDLVTHGRRQSLEAIGASRLFFSQFLTFAHFWYNIFHHPSIGKELIVCQV